MEAQGEKTPKADVKVLLRDFLFALTLVEVMVLLGLDDQSTTRNSNIFELTAEQILTNGFFHSFIAVVAATIAFTLATFYAYQVTRVPEDSPVYTQVRAVGAVLVITYTIMAGFTSTLAFYLGCVLLGLPLF